MEAATQEAGGDDCLLRAAEACPGRAGRFRHPLLNPDGFFLNASGFWHPCLNAGQAAIRGQRAVLIGRENRWDKPSGSCGGECALQQVTTRGQDARG